MLRHDLFIMETPLHNDTQYPISRPSHVTRVILSGCQVARFHPLWPNLIKQRLDNKGQRLVIRVLYTVQYIAFYIRSYTLDCTKYTV